MGRYTLPGTRDGFLLGCLCCVCLDRDVRDEWIGWIGWREHVPRSLVSAALVPNLACDAYVIGMVGLGWGTEREGGGGGCCGGWRGWRGRWVGVGKYCAD